MPVTTLWARHLFKYFTHVNVESKVSRETRRAGVGETRVHTQAKRGDKDSEVVEPLLSVDRGALKCNRGRPFL